MDYLRTIRLGYNVGKPGKQACWMAALSAHLGEHWTDQLECVDSPINWLSIVINEAYYNQSKARTEDILEFGLFEPLDTRETHELSMRRLFYLLDEATRTWLPMALNFIGQKDQALQLYQLKPIVCKSTAYDAHVVVYNICISLRGKPQQQYPFDLDLEICSLLSSFHQIATNTKPFLTINVGENPAWIIQSAKKSRKTNREFIKKEVFPVLRTLIDMGTPKPKEVRFPVCGIEKFKQLVGCA